MVTGKYVCPLETLTAKDVAVAGGKNASLGEMLGELQEKGIHVPEGFAVTAVGYRFFLEANGLEEKIKGLLSKMTRKPKSIQKAGKAIRKLIMKAHLPKELKNEICSAYASLCEKVRQPHLDVAVRSSATAEDLPDASFAGQQETFLNVKGKGELLDACRKCFASLSMDVS